MTICRPPLPRASRRGALLIMVSSIAFILLIFILGLSAYVVDMNRLTRVKWQNDQAQYTASAGLNHLFAYLTTQPNAPNITSRAEVTDSGQRVVVPTGASYRMFLSPVTGSSSARRHYLLESVASYRDPKLDRPVHCRARIEVTQESFAKFEQFVDTADTWDSPYLKEYQDFGTVGLGPIHSNSGCNIFSSCLFAKPFTSSCSSAKFFNNLWDMYYWVRDHDGASPSSQDSVNVAGPQSDLGYPHETVFYGGLSVDEPTITVPGIGNEHEDRTRALRENAQLKLPDDDAGAVAPKSDSYPEGNGGNYQYVLEFGDPSGANGDGVVTVKQYLGWKSSNSSSSDYKRANYRTVGTYALDPNGQGILVRGDIMGLRGTIDGRVTVAAMDHPDSGVGGGDVYVTGELEYESRKNYTDPEGNPFEFPDRDELTAGGQLNESYYASLEGQVQNLDDIMGIVSDGSVLIPEGAEDGGAAALRTNTSYLRYSPQYNNFKTGTVTNLVTNGDPGNPSQIPNATNRFCLDAIVMSTGYNSSSDTFEAVNYLYRDHGWIHTLGGIVTLQTGGWNLFTGSTWTGGIQRYKYWDMRMSDPAASPPFFPLTGNWTIVDDTWQMDYVSSDAG